MSSCTCTPKQKASGKQSPVCEAHMGFRLRIARRGKPRTLLQSYKNDIEFIQGKHQEDLDLFARRVRLYWIIPACKKYNLTFFSDNMRYWFANSKGKLLEYRSDAHQAGITKGLDKVFDLLEIEIDNARNIGHLVGSWRPGGRESLMGTINDKVMVVTGIGIEEAHAYAQEIFQGLEDQISVIGGHLVSPLIKARNGVETFTIGTTGSKLGWGRAEEHEELCERLAQYLDDNGEKYGARWAIVTFQEQGRTRVETYNGLDLSVPHARVDADGTATPKTFLSAPAGRATHGATAHVDRETGKRTRLK